jgi:hypothetical protein
MTDPTAIAHLQSLDLPAAREYVKTLWAEATICSIRGRDAEGLGCIFGIGFLAGRFPEIASGLGVTLMGQEASA